MRRRELVAALPVVVTAGCTIGGEAPSVEGDSLDLTVSDLDDGELPVRYTCDGAGESPPIRIEGVPEAAESVAVVGEWLRGYTPQTIWLLWDLAADETLEIPAGIPVGERVDSPIEATQGRNDEGTPAYRSPCHETDDDQQYRFIAFALPGRPDLDPGADRDAFDAALEADFADVSSTTFRFRYDRFGRSEPS